MEKCGLSYKSVMVSVVGLQFFMITACSHCSFNQITLFQVPFLLYFYVSGMIFSCTEQWNLCCSPHGSIRKPTLTWLTLFGIRPCACAEVQPFLVLDTEFAFLLVRNLGKLIIQLMPLTQYQVQWVVLSNPFRQILLYRAVILFSAARETGEFQTFLPKGFSLWDRPCGTCWSMCMHAYSNENSC